MFNDIGQKLKHLRRSKGLTQDQLSQSSGIPRSTISNYEIGRRSPRNLRELQKLCDYFGVSLDYFGIAPSDEVFDLLTRAQEVFLSPDVKKETKEALYHEFMRLYLNVKDDENDRKNI